MTALSSVIARSEATWQSRIPYHVRWIATSLRYPALVLPNLQFGS
jgi:hypothetical protein